MLSVKKCQIFVYLDLVKIRVEKMLNKFVEKEETFFESPKNGIFFSITTKFFKVSDGKETFLEYKNKIVEILKNCIFPKGLTHALGKKNTKFFFI